MLFSSSTFLFCFLPLALIGYYVLRLFPRGVRRLLQNLFLLVISLLFYAWGEPWFVLVMMASILANYAFGLWVAAAQRRGRSARGPVVAALVVNLGLLFVFKYVTFVLANLNRLGAHFVIPGIELPIGISFFTFQALSYVLDVNRGRGQVQRNPLKVGLYISFFPQLIAGPIVKYETVAQQIDTRRENWADFSAGVCRFLAGLGKKVLISNQLASVADIAWEMGRGHLSVGMAWLGAICYTFQIYYDFSGYSDMAIGLGRMFGFHFLENFNYPYISRSITEFWRRWHISLSTWFRDYVYFPLGGSRVDRPKHVRNLFVVWLLTGIWHGANWTFIVWGLLYFVLLCAEKFGGLGRDWPGWLQWLYTLLMVNFAFVIFRSESMGDALSFLAAMVGLGSGGLWDAKATLFLRENAPVLLAAAIFAAPTALWLRDRVMAAGRGKNPLAMDMGYALLAVLCFVVAASFIVKGTYNPFIYFNF